MLTQLEAMLLILNDDNLFIRTDLAAIGGIASAVPQTIGGAGSNDGFFIFFMRCTLIQRCV